MTKTYEILNDGAFVVTKMDNKLYLGFYHDTFIGDSVERIFEPVGPLSIFEEKDIINYLNNAQ